MRSYLEQSAKLGLKGYHLAQRAGLQSHTRYLAEIIKAMLGVETLSLKAPRRSMLKVRSLLSAVLLTPSSLALLSCQARISEGNRHEAPQQTSNRNRALREWPGAYPEPTGLKGLRSVAVVVYADRNIPSDRIAAGPFADEIKRQVVQKLTLINIALTNEREAESVLSVNMYLVCEADGVSCGHHTTVELKQWVQLERDPDITVAAITWQNSYTNAISKTKLQCCLPDQLEVDALSLISAFVEDYRRANPK